LNLEKPIKNYMKKKPLFVLPTETLGGVAEKMGAEKKDVVIVRDPKGEVKGIVTSHDLFDAMRTWILGKDTRSLWRHAASQAPMSVSLLERKIR
jgi:predicted transcriptional regulator